MQCEVKAEIKRFVFQRALCDLFSLCSRQSCLAQNILIICTPWSPKKTHA